MYVSADCVACKWRYPPFIYFLFIYDEIVQEYTEEYKENTKKTNEQRIGLRHTQRFNNKINVRSS